MQCEVQLVKVNRNAYQCWGIPMKSGGSTKREWAARVIREAILRGDLKPGQRLKQQELAEALEMSATPIREVVRILEAEGLVENIPYKGTFVHEVSSAEAEELTPIRVALESLAVRQAVPNLTGDDLSKLEKILGRMERAETSGDLAALRRYNFDFHSKIYNACGSEILCELIERVWPRFATDILWAIPDRAKASVDHHRAILDLIRDGDAEAAAEKMAEHIRTAGEGIAEYSRDQQQEVEEEESREASRLRMLIG